MKKTILFIFISVLAFARLAGQADFRVIKVNGTILIRDRNVSLETGTVFNEKEDLVFRTDDATAAVINAQKGRLVISSRSHDLANSRSNYLPSMYNISSRGGSLSKSSDLASRFSGRYVVLDREEIEIDNSAFPMDKDHFFFLRYRYKNEDINKKLEFRGDTLIIDKHSLFTVDGNPIPSADNTTIKLYYRKGSESVYISQFDLIFPDLQQLAKEVGIMLKEMKDKTTDNKINEVGGFVNEFYGKVEYESLKKWLAARFSLN